jgi:hypothetical protein
MLVAIRARRQGPRMAQFRAGQLNEFARRVKLLQRLADVSCHFTLWHVSD